VIKQLATFLVVLLLAGPAYAYTFASGSYTGNATDDTTIDISATTSPSVTDFQPDFVLVKCDSANQTVWRTSANAANESLKLINGTPPALTDGIKSFVANGFTVGTGDANINTVTCWYVAIKGSGADVAVGSYTGNAADDRDIDISDTTSNGSADFQPEWVMIQRADNDEIAQTKNSAMPSTTACQFNNSCADNRIQALNANGFQVGTSILTNANLAVYVYVAVKASSGNTFAGTYTGDANTSRDITDVGFQPEWTWTLPEDTGTGIGCARFEEHSGDDSIELGTVASATNQIQTFLSNGFQIGSDTCANENLIVYYHYSIKTQAAAATTRRSRPIFLD
jgi:hypothetical protein